ncbi:MAG: hypothetical protein JXA73_11775 [Acidobacteria bacterium]|nr:hypothetical protein [Acidobacteriota bacterium]
MGVQIDYQLLAVPIRPVDLIRYDNRDKKTVVSDLLRKATPDSNIQDNIGSIFFSSWEIRRAVDLYGEQFCLAVEDVLAAFWAVRRGVPSFALPAWLQNSSADYTTPAVEAAMGEAVAGFLMERIYRASLIHRPRGRAPDIYMMLPSEKSATVEAKATVSLNEGQIDSRVSDALFEILTIWAHIDSVQDLENLEGYSVGVAIGRDMMTAKIVRAYYISEE